MKNRRAVLLWLGLTLLIIGLFVVNLFAAFLPLEKLSWLFTIIGTDLALIIALISIFRATRSPDTGPRIKVGKRYCPYGLSVAPRQPPASEFVGQHQLLDNLQHVLLSNETTGSRVRILTGSFGVGKTRLAQEFAKRAAGCGVDTWWVTASSELLLTCSMGAVAVNVDASREELSRSGCTPDYVHARILAWYREQPRRWLLIIDEADKLSVLGSLQSRWEGTGWLRPPGPKGMVIVTTRDGNREAWNTGWVETHRLGRVSLNDAVRIFRDATSTERLSSTIGTRRDIERLARRLGRLPLALRLVGRYFGQIHAMLGPSSLVDIPTTISGYLAALDDDSRWRETLQMQLDDDEEARDRDNLSKSLELSIQLLESEGLGSSRHLLGLLAGVTGGPLRYDNIRPEFFRKMPRELRALSDPKVLRKTLRRLSDLDLVEMTTVGSSRNVAGASLVVPPITRELAQDDPTLRKIQPSFVEIRQKISRAMLSSR